MKALTSLLVVSSILLILTACDSGPFASAESIRATAEQSLAKRNFSDAASSAQELIKKTPDSSDGYFLLAQAKAQLDEKSGAVSALESAFKRGYKDKKAVEENQNLAPIRQTAGYAELMASTFPVSDKKEGTTSVTEATAGTVGIVQSETKTVIRAGDVVVEMPKEKQP